MSENEGDLETPEEADKVLDDYKLKYRGVYEQWQQARKQQCDCDRATCARCLQVNSLRDQAKRMLRSRW